MAYYPNVKYIIHGKETPENSICFSFLHNTTTTGLTYFPVIHPDCQDFVDKWQVIINELLPPEIINKRIPWVRNEDGSVKCDFVDKPVYCIQLLALTLHRYLQEFPEIVLAFFEKSDTVTTDEGFAAFIEAHKVKLKFYTNLHAHGYCHPVYDLSKDITYGKYLKKLKSSIENNNLPRVQSLFS